MILAAGLCPKIKAGSATEPIVDLKWRGGRQITNLLILPSANSRHFRASTPRCQFGWNGAPGFNRKCAFSRQTLKSVRIANAKDTVEVMLRSLFRK